MLSIFFISVGLRNHNNFGSGSALFNNILFYIYLFLYFFRKVMGKLLMNNILSSIFVVLQEKAVFLFTLYALSE